MYTNERKTRKIKFHTQFRFFDVKTNITNSVDILWKYNVLKTKTCWQITKLFYASLQLWSITVGGEKNNNNNGKEENKIMQYSVFFYARTGRYETGRKITGKLAVSWRVCEAEGSLFYGTWWSLSACLMQMISSLQQLEVPRRSDTNKVAHHHHKTLSLKNDGENLSRLPTLCS